ncbi:MAG: hypothetical protein Q9187_000739 [Circinaria calcarea]
MDPLNTRRLLLPKPVSSRLGRQPYMAHADHPIPTSLALAQQGPRQLRSASKTEEEWDAQKLNFHRLYVEEDLPLKVAMEEMEKQYSFKASLRRKQYNTKISQWHFDKKVKEHEMRVIIRKQRKRKAEDPPKESSFRVRKQPVGSNKIERFKMEKRIDDDIEMPDAETPSDISCYTPHVEHVELVAQEITPISVNPALRMLSNSPQLSMHSPDQHHMINSLSPAQTNLNHGSPPISPFIRNSSPLYWRSSRSPDQNIRSPLSLPPRHRTSSNSFASPVQIVSRIAQPSLSPSELFEAYVNYRSRSSSRTPSGNILADVIRQWIMQADTYQDQRRQEALGSTWSIIRSYIQKEGPPFPFETECKVCKVCRAFLAMWILEGFLHYRANHPERLPGHIDEDFPISITFQDILPAFESSNRDDILRVAAQIVTELVHASRIQEAYKILDALWQQVRHENAVEDSVKNLMILKVAQLFIENQRYDEGDKMIRDVLGFEYEGTVTFAMEITEQLDVESDFDEASRYFGGKYASEVRAREKAEIGTAIEGQAIARFKVLLKALSLLQQLYRHRRVEVLDED